ncbi:NGG1 interacting factor [Cichlidogyrus casuarinus]|uniref:NIF3-like protein 1 n=1 Tax=Cichlidogyrus casuarinus TaxID=1844966 RepID=A0ABD2Q5E4_9PLAT
MQLNTLVPKLNELFLSFFCISQVAKFKYPKCQQAKVEETANAHGMKFLTKEIIHRPNPMASGAGRVAMLERSQTVEDMVTAYKNLLGLNHLTVCLGNKKTPASLVSTLAVCSGSGGGMLTRQAPAMLADLVVTGEATYHEQQEITGRGSSLILIGQHKIERAYLSVRLQPNLSQKLSGLEILMSKNDKGTCQSM